MTASRKASRRLLLAGVTTAVLGGLAAAGTRETGIEGRDVGRAPASPGEKRGRAGVFSDPEVRRRAAERRGAVASDAKARAWEEARLRGYPVKGRAGDAWYELMAIENGRPVYNVTDNADAAISVGTDLVRDTAPYNVNGGGLTVGVWEGGCARTTHQEFGGRVNVMDGSTTDDHATTVSGTLAAGGVDPAALGMAPMVGIDAYDWTLDDSEMTARAASFPGEAGKIYVSNHSYSKNCGWKDGNFSGNIGPHWLGTWGNREDEEFGMYSAEARGWDVMVHNAPYFLPFKSAGNDRNDDAPPVGATLYYFDVVWLAKTFNPATDPYADGFDGGFDTMTPRSCAKNVVTVGAVTDAVSGGVRDPGAASMMSFSAWGPTDDGRIKPDVVANGEGLYTPDGTSDLAYTTVSGTSMAAPNASGSAALLVEYYQDLFPGDAMRAATLKGLLIHTADDLGNPGPDYRYGWGLVNVKAAADHVRAHYDAPRANHVVERNLDGFNAAEKHTFRWDGTSPIRATLCWTDPPATAVAGLDVATPRLVNDLDLVVIGPGGSGTHLSFVLDPAAPSLPAGTGNNVLDNVEQVFIVSPGVAGVYTAEVTHKGSLTGGEQDYSLLISGQLQDDLDVSPIEDFDSVRPEGAGFSPESKTYVLGNMGSGTMDWSATVSCQTAEAWLSVAPAGGTLGPGLTTTVTVSLTPFAYSLPMGAHHGTVTFTNATTGFIVYRDVNLDVQEPMAADFALAASSGAEAVPSVSLEVTLSAVPGNTVTVDYAATGGTAAGGVDYTLAAGTLTFNPGVDSLSIDLTVIDDLLDEADETVVVTLSAPSNSTLGATPAHTYTILDDDPTPTVAFDQPASGGAESVTPVQIAVSLSAASGRTVTVDYVPGGDATGGGVDYVLSAGPVTFAPGATAAAITLTVVDDPMDEPDEQIDLVLAAPSNATLGAAWTHAYTILDDDATPTIEFALAASSVPEIAGSASLVVTLSAPSGQEVRVDYATTGGTATAGEDFDLLPGMLVFASGETVKIIPVAIVDDWRLEDDETVTVALSGVSGAAFGPRVSHELSIVDNEVASSGGCGAGSRPGSALAWLLIMIPILGAGLLRASPRSRSSSPNVGPGV